jgi:DNA primase
MNIFTFIKSRISIVDVINEYATLRKAGGYWKARCPFHHEKTGSFTVSPHKEIFYCFGCHKSGDVISFIADVENCSQIEAAKYIAERYQIELPEDLQSSHSQQEKNHYQDICTTVADWCHEHLKKSPSVLAYLNQRDITEQSIDYFKIGYFPSGLIAIKNLIHEMKNQNILVDDLIEAAIIAQGKTVLYSPFEERIIFPIADTMGNYCGFGGRIFKPNDQRPKYYNSHENDFFSKGSLLFGLDMAKKAIQETGHVFLVEGYTDCVAMAQHGYRNAVATLGTACTLQHLKLLARYANDVYVLYDGDAAGKQAILRLTQLCWQANTELKVIELPEGEDPASFLEKEGDLKALIAQAQDIFGFFIASMGTNFKTKSLNERVNLTRKLLETIASVDDALKADMLLQQAASTLGMPLATLTREMERIQNTVQRAPQDERNGGKAYQNQENSKDFPSTGSSIRPTSQSYAETRRGERSEGNDSQKNTLNPKNQSNEPKSQNNAQSAEKLPHEPDFQKNTFNSENISSSVRPEELRDHSSLLEKKIFCAIINNAQLLNSTNEKYLTNYMPQPLRDILQKLNEYKSNNQSIAFVSFFDTLSDTHKQYVSRLLVEFEQDMTPELFDTLLLALQKQQWKVITLTIKDQLTQAKQAGDENKVAQILQDYLELKSKMLPQVART